MLFLFGYFMNQQDMYASFGFHDSTPIIIGLILFLQLVFIPYNEASVGNDTLRNWELVGPSYMYECCLYG